LRDECRDLPQRRLLVDQAVELGSPAAKAAWQLFSRPPFQDRG
jgi:hypothetical protein